MIRYHMPMRLAFVVPIVAVLLGLTAASPASAESLDFFVNTTKDLADANIGDGICAAANGKCSLRAAVQEANATPDADTISLPAGTFKLSVAGIFEDEAATGDLDVVTSITIVGEGAGKTIINGKKRDRIFDVRGSGTTLRLERVRLQNGKAPEEGEGGCISVDGAAVRLETVDVTISGCRAGAGAAIRVVSGSQIAMNRSVVKANIATSGGALYLYQAETTDLTQTSFINNTATDGESVGGAIWAEETTLVLEDSVISGNSARYGGGIYGWNAVMNIEESTLRGNSGAWGGAMYAGQSPVSLRGALVENNHASISGGGAHIYDTALATISESTFSGNKAPDGIGSGGGITLESAQADIFSSTFSSNRAGFGGGIALTNEGERHRSLVTAIRLPPSLSLRFATITKNRAGEGGGIAVDTGALEMTGVILSKNKATSGADCYSGLSVTANDIVITAASGCSYVGENVTVGDAALGPLRYLFPGKTPVHVPAIDSPVLGAAADCAGTPYDQRGVERPELSCDIGAVQVDARDLIMNGNFEDGLKSWSLKQNGTSDKVKGKMPYTGKKALLLKGKADKKTVLQQKIKIPAGMMPGDEIVGIVALYSEDVPTDITIELKVRYKDKSGIIGYVQDFTTGGGYGILATHQFMIDSGKPVKSITFRVVDKSPSGKRYIDYASVLWFAPAWAPRADRAAGLLPAPAAPAGFRGGN